MSYVHVSPIRSRAARVLLKLAGRPEGLARLENCAAALAGDGTVGIEDVFAEEVLPTAASAIRLRSLARFRRSAGCGSQSSSFLAFGSAMTLLTASRLAVEDGACGLAAELTRKRDFSMIFSITCPSMLLLRARVLI